jgi:hypothetical protein
MQLVEYSLDQLASATQKGASAEHLLGTVPDGPSNGAFCFFEFCFWRVFYYFFFFFSISGAAADKGAAATSKTAGKTTRK